MGEHMLDVESCGAFCVDFFPAWYKNGGLRAVMVRDSKNGVISLRFREFSDEIQSYSFEWHSFGFWINGSEWRLSGTVIDFVALTIGASLYIVRNVFAHPWPPVVALHYLYRFANSWMSVYWRIVVCFDDFALAF